MRKPSVFFILILIATATPAAGQKTGQTNSSLQTIRLKDGTVINGKLTAVSGDQYAIDSPTLGQIRIKTTDLESITAAGTAVPTAQSSPAKPSSLYPQQQIPAQIQGLGNKMLSDPQIAARAQEIAQDPELQKLLADPALLQAAMSMDPQQIQNNPKIQQLMQNPQMQQLMEMISKKLLSQEGSSSIPTSR